MVYGQRAVGRIQSRYGIQRDELPLGGTDVQQRERSGIALVLRLQFHDDAVFVVGRVDGGDLPGTVGSVERAFHLLRGTPTRRALTAVNPPSALRLLILQ